MIKRFLRVAMLGLGAVAAMWVIAVANVGAVREFAPGWSPGHIGWAASLLLLATVALRGTRDAPQFVRPDPALARVAYATALICVAAVIVVGALLAHVDSSGDSVQESLLGGGRSGAALLDVSRGLSFVLLEEALFRGWLLGVALQTFRFPTAANRFQAAVFALGHAGDGGLGAVIWTYIGGSFFGRTVLATGSLRLAVLLHLFLNVMHVVVFQHTCATEGVFECDSMIGKALFYCMAFAIVGPSLYLGHHLEQRERNAASTSREPPNAL